jgi:hypothetical protein
VSSNVLNQPFPSPLQSNALAPRSKYWKVQQWGTVKVLGVPVCASQSPRPLLKGPGSPQAQGNPSQGTCLHAVSSIHVVGAYFLVNVLALKAGLA